LFNIKLRENKKIKMNRIELVTIAIILNLVSPDVNSQNTIWERVNSQEASDEGTCEKSFA